MCFYCIFHVIFVYVSPYLICLAGIVDQVAASEEASNIFTKQYTDNFQTLAGPCYQSLKQRNDDIASVEGSSYGPDSRITAGYRRRANKILDIVSNLPPAPDDATLE